MREFIITEPQRRAVIDVLAEIPAKLSFNAIALLQQLQVKEQEEKEKLPAKKEKPAKTPLPNA